LLAAPKVTRACGNGSDGLGNFDNSAVAKIVPPNAIGGANRTLRTVKAIQAYAIYLSPGNRFSAFCSQVRSPSHVEISNRPSAIGERILARMTTRLPMTRAMGSPRWSLVNLARAGLSLSTSSTANRRSFGALPTTFASDEQSKWTLGLDDPNLIVGDHLAQQSSACFDRYFMRADLRQLRSMRSCGDTAQKALYLYEVLHGSSQFTRPVPLRLRSMTSKIEDYALIGDCETAALVGRDGCIDWLCLPRFDSDACFAALLGTPENGRWLLAPALECRTIRRRYRGDTLILETSYENEAGAAAVIDFMPMRTEAPVLVRIVEGKRGNVDMHMQLLLRFGYGRIVPWVERYERGIRAIGGPDGVLLRADVDLHGRGLTTVADFTVTSGQRVAFTMAWFPSHCDPPSLKDAAELLAKTEQSWQDWANRSAYRGRWPDAVARSLITLKALTYAPTGGIVAAPTTSLPERLGGERNWDYRFCWLRDATMSLLALLSAGYVDEAAAWRDWLLRAVAGSPSDMQIAYGVRGERRLTELTLDWLPGYENSRPVRIGNAASEQFQLDVFGELMDAMLQSRRANIHPNRALWNLEVALVQFLGTVWQEPDEGIWEIRGPKRHFTHSKVMAWVAIDRAIKSIEHFGLSGPLDVWRRLRAKIHDDVCRNGFDNQLNSFVQYYGGQELDASLLMIPLVGFLPAADPRVLGTVRAIERELLAGGLLRRYSLSNDVDGLHPGEGSFLPCTFWLADNYRLMGRRAEAEEVFERLLDLRNDVGLLSEEYDSHNGRMVGNFPQALSHIALVNSATNLSEANDTRQCRSAD